MFESFLGFLTSAAGGGLLGLFGSLAKGWMESRERRAEREHQLAMRKADMDERRLEAELQLRVIETEGEIARDVAASELQAASYSHDRATYSAGHKLTGIWGRIAAFLLVLVDVTRGFMRPVLTAYVVVISSVIAWHLYTLVERFEALTADLHPRLDAWPLLVEVVQTVLFLTVAAFAWWFGSRPTTGSKA